MASTSTTLGSNLRPNLAWCSPNFVTGLGGLGLLQLLAPGRFAKSERRNHRYGLCRAAQSSSSSSSSQRHVVITGGNTGIGKATAIELARQGMAVTIGSMQKLGEGRASCGRYCSSIQ